MRNAMPSPIKNCTPINLKTNDDSWGLMLRSRAICCFMCVRNIGLKLKAIGEMKTICLLHVIVYHQRVRLNYGYSNTNPGKLLFQPLAVLYYERCIALTACIRRSCQRPILGTGG
jgi:hypothetical protein